MTSISKPSVRHPSAQKNQIGLTKADYEGGMSTLCAGGGGVIASQTVARATSSDSPMRLQGMSRSRTESKISGEVSFSTFMGVRIAPGEMAFTRMRRWATSWARLFMRSMMPPLAAA